MYKNYKTILLIYSTFFSSILIYSSQLEKAPKKSLKRSAEIDSYAKVSAASKKTKEKEQNQDVATPKKLTLGEQYEAERQRKQGYYALIGFVPDDPKNKIIRNCFQEKEALFASYASDRKKREDAGEVFHPFGVNPEIYFPKRAQKPEQSPSK